MKFLIDRCAGRRIWDQGFKRSYRKRIHKHPHLKRKGEVKL